MPTEPPVPDSRRPSDMLYGEYDKHRDFLLASDQTISTSYTKWLLTLSGGGLGLSITFARGIADPDGASAPWCLAAAWIILTVAVGSGLAALFVSQRGHEQSRVLLDHHMGEVRAGGATEVGFWPRYNDAHAGLKTVKCVGIMNLASMVSFLIGVIMLACFAYYNVPGR